MSDAEFAAGMGKLEELLARAEQCCAPETLGIVRELVRSLLEVHRLGLGELLRALEEENAATVDAVRAAAARPAVAGLLLMHELHPDALQKRVDRALRESNDAGAGAATAELLRLDGADMWVRVTGRPAAAELLAKVVERVLCERAPDGTLHLDVTAVGVDLPQNVVPLARLRARSGGAV